MLDLPSARPEDVGFNSQSLQRIVRWQQHLFDTKRLPFTQVVVGRKGKVCHFSTVGQRDIQAGIAAEPDTICRMYSMTKPVTAVALMTLYEEGRFQLGDPVHLYLGEKWRKKNMKVYKSGDAKSGYSTDPCERTVTIRDVLCHTSGLSYGFDADGIANKVDGIYNQMGIAQRHGDKMTLAEFVDKLPEAPLQFQPGSHWSYGFNLEVVGRIIEVISGQLLDEFFKERIFKPLRMKDTDFVVPSDQRHRFARCYMRAKQAKGTKPRDRTGLVDITDGVDAKEMKFTPAWKLFEPGGGLVGTVSDYARFAQMLLNGGELDGQVVLSRKTVEFMTVNHLPKNQDMGTMFHNAGYTGRDTEGSGAGMGLGMSVLMDPPKSKLISSTGTFDWSGAASTHFWCDPKEDLFCVFTTQFFGSDPLAMPLRSNLSQLVYGAMRGDLDPSRERMLPVPRSKL